MLNVSEASSNNFLEIPENILRLSCLSGNCDAVIRIIRFSLLLMGIYNVIRVSLFFKDFSRLPSRFIDIYIDVEIARFVLLY